VPSSAAIPSNFATSKPAANADLDNAGDMEDDDADEPIDMKPATPKFGGANSPFAPKPPVPFGSKSRPAPKPSQLPLNDKPDDDEEDELDEADIPAAKPASPFGSKPAGASPFAPKPAQPAAASPASNPNPNAPRSPFGSPGSSPSGGSPFNRPPVTATPALPEKKADEPSVAADKPDAKPLAPVASTTPASSPADPKPSAPAEPVIVRSKQAGVWEMPEYSDLLERGSVAKADQEYLNERARIIEDTLQSFGSPGKVVEINTGPVITQFGVEPDYLVSRQGKKTRVKVGSIAKLDADLALALAARTIRIEAPVPGKGYVGIEVPNSKPSVVSLRDIMDEPAYQKINSRLRVALGRSVDGHPIVADLTTMPHLLIAGTTGSGKSVCVNAIISTLLLENSPDDLRFIMVDPKRVELTGYNGIPHLVEGMPVVVDLERIVGVLKWVTREMEERYKRFAAATARNIVDFNSKLPPGGQKLPYLVVVIDELADLMMLAPEETEKTLARLAQMARATGIHLIVSTQRPSVDVVTGLIKANFPARISFAVASSVDSRVILDQPGAEKLLGRGDMLYQAPDAAAPMRCQGVYLSDNEITKITQYWKGQRGRSTSSPSLAPPNRAIMDVPPAEPIQSRSERLGITNGTGSGAKPGTPTPTTNKLFEKDPPGLNRPAVTSAPPSDDDDELYAEAVKIYNENDGKVGIQLLQRRLRVGYMRAARLIDLMKQRGLNIDNKAGVTEEAVEDEE
jgi:S-DNA-T family DNA segregation ATPase FtsK/SpoIIIE